MAMVGLLQAPTGTELYKRLKREGRLLGEFPETTSSMTRTSSPAWTGRHSRTNYRALVKALYEPRNYYNRVRNLLARVQGAEREAAVDQGRRAGSAAVFFLAGPDPRRPGAFLAGFLWACLHKRESVQNFLGLAILGYHFRKIHEDLLGRRTNRANPRELVEKQHELPEPAMLR